MNLIFISVVWVSSGCNVIIVNTVAIDSATRTVMTVMSWYTNTLHRASIQTHIII